MAYINGHKVISVVRTVYQSELDLVARYHLGEYDTYQDNNDGTATITRQTAYYTFTGNETYNYGAWQDYAITIQVPNPTVPAISGINNFVVCGVWNNCRITYTNSSNYIYFEGATNSFASLDEFKPYIIGKFIQYKTATSYTEQVIVNRPLNTLDQTGSQWLRSEWEKGLNLFNVSKITNGDINGNYGVNAYTLGNGTVSITDRGNAAFNRVSLILTLSSGTYSFKANVSNQTRLFIEDSNGNGIYDNTTYNGANINFTISNSTTLAISLYAYSTTSCVWTNIMLNEGDHAYPYQEYNGELIHRKDIEPVLLWENASPNATLSTAEITLDAPITNYKYLVIAYKYEQYGGIYYTKIKTANSGTYYLIGTSQISGTESGVCRTFIITESGTKINFYNDKVFGGANGYGKYCIPIAIYGIDAL